ncbi:MAG TPA: PQQ-binding-like beta-propeller repeat protein [Opitutaceae bacterium]|nr:PQQ-binding-like beta-propeller repeat protein [Opitutaceae bacterium]
MDAPARLCRRLGFAAAALFLFPTARADAPDFEGVWLGEVTAPNATTAIGFAFERGRGGLILSFYMPAMFVYGTKLGPVEIERGAVQFAPLATSLERTGDRLTGTFGLSHLPVALHRAEKFPAAPPAPSFPPGPEPRWSVSLGAEAWASPVVREGIVYVGTADGKFHARDAVDGHARWTWTGPNPLYGTALLTPARVCFIDARDDLVCLDRASGALAWRVALAAAPAGSAAPADETFNHRTATPLEIDGVLYAGATDGNICAIDAATGATRWRHDAKTKLHAAPAADGDRLVFGGFDGTLLALDRRTGAEIARARLPGAIVSTPAIAGDVLVVGARDYMLYGLKRADLSIAWRFSYWFSWVESSAVVVDGLAYIGGSDFARVTALDPATGRARWSTETGGITWGTPLVVADTIYIGTSAQGDALIRHAGSLNAIDRKTGAVKWRRLVPLAGGAPRAGYLGSLARSANDIIGIAFDGTLSAFPLAP